jgi:hypothetical protein
VRVIQPNSPPQHLLKSSIHTNTTQHHSRPTLAPRVRLTTHTLHHNTHAFHINWRASHKRLRFRNTRQTLRTIPIRRQTKETGYIHATTLVLPTPKPNGQQSHLVQPSLPTNCGHTYRPSSRACSISKTHVYAGRHTVPPNTALVPTICRPGPPLSLETHN